MHILPKPLITRSILVYFKKNDPSGFFFLDLIKFGRKFIFDRLGWEIDYCIVKLFKKKNRFQNKKVRSESTKTLSFHFPHPQKQGATHSAVVLITIMSFAFSFRRHWSRRRLSGFPMLIRLAIWRLVLTHCYCSRLTSLTFSCILIYH